MITLLGVLFIDVFEGMIIGLVASLLLIIYHSSRPHVSFTRTRTRGPGSLFQPGTAPGEQQHSRSLNPAPGWADVLCQCFDGSRSDESHAGCRSRADSRAVVLDSSGQYALDITTVDVLKGLVEELKHKGIDFYVAEAQWRCWNSASGQDCSKRSAREISSPPSTRLLTFMR